MIEYDCTVSGTVQGVCFRYYAQKKARALGIRGNIRNTPDGDVFVIAQHYEEKVLLEFLEWLNKGPDMAVVTDVKTAKIYDDDVKERFDDFRVVY